MKCKLILSLITIVIIASVITMFLGYVEEETPVPTPIQVVTPTYTSEPTAPLAIQLWYVRGDISAEPFKIDYAELSASMTVAEYRNTPRIRLPSSFNLSTDIFYAIPAYKKVSKIQSIQTLERELPTLEEYYRANVCDCSDLSAYMEWWLECHGVHAYIVEGTLLPHPEITIGNQVYGDGEGGPHAWVEAEIGGQTVLIESTIAYIVPDQLERYYITSNKFEDLDELFTYYYESGYVVTISEHDWWNSFNSII